MSVFGYQDGIQRRDITHHIVFVEVTPSVRKNAHLFNIVVSDFKPE